MELLVVIAVIVILAGLTISIMGNVQSKGARSRAQAEVASITAAIDSYFLDTGSYPPMDEGGSNTTKALYTALCPAGSGKVYLEPKSSMLKTNGTISFIDPWGDDYFYSTNREEIKNVGLFDFWSNAGTADKAADDIRN